MRKKTLAEKRSVRLIRNAFKLFERTGRVNKTLAKYIDKDTLKFLTELHEFCKRLDEGKVSNRELCRFIDRLIPDKN